jgi:hypothetical protein
MFSTPRAALLLLALSSSAAAQTFPERTVGSAITAKSARVSLTPTGPWLATPIAAETYLSIYDDGAGRPRFGDYVPDARLLLYVDRDALHTVSVGTAVVQPRPVAAPKDVFSVVGFVPRAGTPLEIVEPEKDGFVKVRLATLTYEVTGFVATSSLGTTFQYLDVVRPAWKANTYLPESFSLLDKPNGAAFLTAKPIADREAMILKRSAGHALVRTSNDAVGWIAAKKLARIPPGGVEGGEAGGVEGGVVGGVSTKTTLVRGTPLFDGIDGGFVGVASFFTAKPAETKGVWTRYDLKTPFGTIAVWSSSQITPEPAPQNVAPALLEGSRIAGEKNLVPDDETKKQIMAAGKDKLIGSWKLCLDRAGTITVIKKLKGTGFASYDTIIETGMGQWRYKPYQVNGTAVPVCTAVTFIYSQK